MDVESAIKFGFGCIILLIGGAVLYALWPVKTRTERSASPVGATAPEGIGSLSGATPTVARAALTPDCPSLDTEYWRANPIEPLAPSEVVRWNGIVARYEWVAPTVVVPGRES